MMGNTSGCECEYCSWFLHPRDYCCDPRKEYCYCASCIAKEDTLDREYIRQALADLENQKPIPLEQLKKELGLP